MHNKISNKYNNNNFKHSLSLLVYDFQDILLALISFTKDDFAVFSQWLWDFRLRLNMFKQGEFGQQYIGAFPRKSEAAFE